MKNFLLAAVAAVSLGMTGVALAATPVVHHVVGVQLAGNNTVLPSQRPTYLAKDDIVLPSQRPAYLAKDDVVLPSQRPIYLAGNSTVFPNQRPAYLA